MSGWFGSKPDTPPPPQSTQPTKAAGISIQSSVFGKAIPVLFGRTRIGGNLNLYGNFVATAIYSSPEPSGGGGGKGGLFGGGGGGQTAQPTITGYNYAAAFGFILCEGPIADVGNVWQDKNTTSLASLGFSLFTGTYPQAPWGTTVTWDGGSSSPLGYPGLAYVAAANYSLGTSTSLPNHTFEVYGIGCVSNNADAVASQILTQVLSNPHFGIGFPSNRIGDLSVWEDYCYASNLFMSPAYDTQRTVQSIGDELCKATNSAAVWSSGKLRIVPYGDKQISGNGRTYTPPQVPEYDLTDDDFIASPQGSAGSSSTTGDGPILLIRKRPSDKINQISVEFLDRSNNYNPGIAMAKDQALIDTYGLRTNGSDQYHMFCDPAAASLCANLLLRREYVSNTYQFDLDQRFCLLDPMDIVTLTDEKLGLDKQWVRITDITENDDGTLSFIVEEYLEGTGAAPAYSFARGIGYNVNTNSPPGSNNAPIFFEPPDALAGALQVWCALSGPSNWGGADVYVSTDGNTYEKAGRISGSSRTGVLGNILPSYPEAVTGQTIDQTNTVNVNLIESRGALNSVTQSLARSLNTLCFADGELIAYATANLAGPSDYALSYLIRGAYGSTISEHAANSKFVRVDGSMFKIPFTQDRIGQRIYVKFASFNQFGGGQISLAEAPEYSYTILGSALTSPLPDITNLTRAFLTGSMTATALDWSEIQDFRPVEYEIRKGSSWEGGQPLAVQAHPPFRTQGDGTYWVAAKSQPVANLIVYSENPTSIVVDGSSLTENIIVTHQQNPGWAGALTGNVAVSGSVIETTGADGGIYTIPVGDRVILQGVASCAVLISWTSTGTPADNNWNAITDFMANPDLFGGAAAANVSVYPEIRLSQDGTTWGPWQKYQSGVYTAKGYDARWQVKTLDPTIKAVLETASFGVDVPDRSDHYNAFAVGGSGSTLTFDPTPFNGGPQGTGTPGVPHILAAVVNGLPGDTCRVTSISLSSCFVRCYDNTGAAVARAVNVLAEGY